MICVCPLRRQQAHSLVKLICELKTANPNCGPVIMCGDFNGEPKEKFYEVVSNIDDMASAYKVIMVVLHQFLLILFWPQPLSAQIMTFGQR